MLYSIYFGCTTDLQWLPPWALLRQQLRQLHPMRTRRVVAAQLGLLTARRTEHTRRKIPKEINSVGFFKSVRIFNSVGFFVNSVWFLNSVCFFNIVCTDKKENQIFLLYEEIQSGAVSKSNMRKGFLIYEEMRKYFPTYEEAVSHTWLYNCFILKILIYEENLIIFFISVFLKSIKEFFKIN